MCHYFFLVGMCGTGKSTVQRNLRLRWDGHFSSDEHQVTTKDTVIFGRILFQNGKKLLTLPGGDGTHFDYTDLFTLGDKASKVLWEGYDIPFSVLEKLVAAGHRCTILHLVDDFDTCVERRNKRSPRGSSNELTYKLDDRDWQQRRDLRAVRMGVNVVYINEPTIKGKCEVVEGQMGVTPSYDRIVETDSLEVNDWMDAFECGE